MFDKSVITSGGARLLEQWVLGGTLTIERAAAGSGTVPAEALASSAKLVHELHDVPIVARTRTDGGIQLHLQFAQHEQRYVVNQVGVWAKLDGGDGDGQSALLAVYQDETGYEIPSAAEMADFVFAFYAPIAVSNTGTLSVHVDPSAYLTMDTLTEVEEQLEGLVTGAEARMEELLDKAGLKDVYTPSNPPPYPVTSVNGATGAVNITDITGNAATATKLAAARKINGVPFDGTEDIAVADDTKVPTGRKVNGKALTGDIALTARDVGAPVGQAAEDTSNAYVRFEGFPENSTVERLDFVYSKGDHAPWMHVFRRDKTDESIRFVRESRKINGLPLSQDIDIPISTDCDATIPHTGWSLDASGFQTVEVACVGLFDTDHPIIDVALTGSKDADEAILNDWALVSMIKVDIDKFKVYAVDIPSRDIPIHIKVVY